MITITQRRNHKRTWKRLTAAIISQSGRNGIKWWLPVVC